MILNWGELITLEYGKPVKDKESTDGKVPVYGTNGQIGTSHLPAQCKHPSFILGRKGAYRGVNYSDCPFSVIDTAFYAEPLTDRIDLKWAYYKFLTYDINGMDSGSAIPSTDRYQIYSIEVEVPPLEKQRKIVAVLDCIDRKININQKVNDNLEQQAMALYAEMFLNSSNNDVTSGTLSDIAVITMGQSPSGSSYNEDGVGEVFYQGRAEFGFRFPKRRLFTTEPKRMAVAGDVLLSVRAPVGDLNMAYERCCIGRGLGAIHSKTGHSSFVLYTMFALRSQLNVFNGEGTVFGSINRDALNAIPIDVPLVTKIDRFEAVAHPIDELIRTNYEENCRLEAIRNLLLPKLMSGEIDVSAIRL